MERSERFKDREPVVCTNQWCARTIGVHELVQDLVNFEV